MTKYWFLTKHARRVSTFGSSLLKDSHSKESEKPNTAPTVASCKLPAKDPSCPSVGTMNICLVEPVAPPAKPCKDIEVDPEWEMTEKSSPKGPRVIIIGAGLAGLSAAERLIRAGHTNLLVLEADCRAGGRLRSRWAEDTVVELGFALGRRKPLNWSHPILSFGLLDRLYGPPANGDPTSGILDADPPLPVMLRAYSAIRGLIHEEQCKKNMPRYKGVRVEQAGRTMPSLDRSNAAKVMAAMASLMGPKLQVVEDSFGAFVVAPGGTRVPLGDSGLLIPLLEKIGKDNIVYRKEAVAIRWGTVTLSQIPRAIVRCRDGSEYPCEFVIISSSLGNLKNTMESMFYPPLPSKKVRAIEKLDFVQANKAFLIFDEPIWTWSNKPIDIMITPEKKSDQKGEKKEKVLKVEATKISDEVKEKKDSHEQIITTEGKKEGWEKGIVEIKQVEGSQKVLAVRVVGKEAVQMERATKEAIMETLHAFLQEKLGIRDIPKPKDLIKSKWSDSRYFSGYHTAPGLPEHRAELAKPLPSPDQLPPILLFAGEATSTNHNPFQGAVMSGLREAERLIRILDSLPKPVKDVCPTICK